MAQQTQEAQQQPQTKSAIVVAEDKAERKKDHLRVLVTNATIPMAHTIATAVAQGYVFGYDQPIILHLLDAKGTMGMLEGLVLELLDCTYPLLRQVLMTTVDDSAFTGIDAAFLLYETQNAPVDQGVQLFRRYGAALEKYAKRSVKVVVCGCQVAINAFACIDSAPSIDSRNISALTRLEHNQALAQIASKLAVAPNKVRNVVVWGGYGRVPDAYNAGTPEGTWVSMGVVSNGAYGVPKGIVYSFPVRIENKEWHIVEGIDVNPNIKERIDDSAQRTMNEIQSAVRVGVAA
ncbi:hypothetical protein HPB49_008034 [Dermacentor silvarum]|uniref:Uncharacterized protein n=1 Tax=Dermacentor silvarum TaxID=543639 RepID=A0ACB8CJX5_DERSI|nr:hypothetical protein HPB49_008034 [Dermacentor silvarum]